MLVVFLFVVVEPFPETTPNSSPEREIWDKIMFKVAEIFSCGSSNPAKAVLRGRAGGGTPADNLVIYPPRCTLLRHYRTQVSLVRSMGPGLSLPDLTDLTPTDEDNNSIPTDGGNRTYVGNGKWRPLVENL